MRLVLCNFSLYHGFQRIHRLCLLLWSESLIGLHSWVVPRALRFCYRNISYSHLLRNAGPIKHTSSYFIGLVSTAINWKSCISLRSLATKWDPFMNDILNHSRMSFIKLSFLLHHYVHQKLQYPCVILVAPFFYCCRHNNNSSLIVINLVIE